MNDKELKEALDGLFAYDSGCVDSGIKDEVLKKQVIEELKKDLLENQIFSDRLSRIAREMFLSEDAIKNGHGLEDLREFIDWIENL